MKRFYIKTGLMIAVLTLGVFSIALARGGYGGAYDGRMMGRTGPAAECWAGTNTPLSTEDAAALKQARLAFLSETQELRNQIEQKRLALSQELLNAEPNKAKAVEIQKELSKLKAEFALKALENRLELRKKFPNLDFTRGLGRGDGCGW